MTLQEIALSRLINQQIHGTTLRSPKDIVKWMGAIQAQDYAMSKWAVGIRLTGSSLPQIDQAFDKGEILRTHLLRPTWHLVESSDIYWMLELTAPQIRVSMKSRWKELELDQTIINKSNSIIEKTLSKGKHHTREELMMKLQSSGIATDDQRAAHLMLSAEMDQIVCSGIMKGKKTTYALLEERVPKKKLMKKDEALAELARRYFTSHAPATLSDFIWWSGLNSSAAKRGFEMIQKDFTMEKINDTSYWVPDSFSFRKSKKDSVFFLPAFDEFLISYKDRSASLLLENQKHTISNNGIFRPVILENGQVVGLWSRIVKKETVLIKTHYFKPLKRNTKELAIKAAGALGEFLGLKVELV